MTGFARFALVPLLAGVALTVAPTRSSDLIGIYGIIDKVVILPDTANPKTIQIWGVFALSKNIGGDN